MSETKKKTAAPKPVSKKPYLTGKPLDSSCIGGAMRFFLYLLMMAIAFLFLGAVNLIHAYDPEVLLLSGGPCHSEMLMQRIRRYVRENVWTPWGQVDIRVAENPEGSVLLGLIRE